MSIPNFRQFTDACRFLGLDHKGKFLSVKQRQFFREVQRRWIEQPLAETNNQKQPAPEQNPGAALK